jgi:hypothetical protein
LRKSALFRLGLAWLACANGAYAQAPSPKKRGPPAPAPASSPKPPRAARPRADQARNYAQAPGTDAADVALFVPRLLLAVPRYGLKLVFFPVREAIRFLDKHALVEEITDVLYNDDRTAAIVPAFAIDSFLGPSLGVKAFHEDLAGHGEYGSAEARIGGVYSEAAQLHFRADRFGGSRLWLESIARLETAPGLLFEGIGQPARRASGSGLGPREAAVASRFYQERLLNFFRAGYTFGEQGSLVQLGATSLYNVRRFSSKAKGAEPSIEQVYDVSRLVGFDQRVAVFETDLNLVVDTRDVSGATSSGVYAEAFAGRVPHVGKYGFWHEGAEITGYLDLYRRTRVLVLRAALEGVEGSDQDIPFSELPRLGGSNRLRGYRLDRFRDEKAALGTIEYHYPIHEYVAGALYMDLGRVAHSYASLIDTHWKAGFGAGFLIRTRHKQLLSFDIAYGEGLQLLITTDPLRAFANRDTEL